MVLYSWYLNNSKVGNSKFKQVTRCNNWPIAKVENENLNTTKVSPLAHASNGKIVTTPLFHYNVWQKVSFEK